MSSFRKCNSSSIYLYRVCDLCVAGAGPGVVAQCDDVVVILLQEEGEVVGEAGQEVVLRPEGHT